MSKSRSLSQAKFDFLDYYCQLLPEFTPESLSTFLSLKNTPVILVSPLHISDIQTLWQKHHLSYSPLGWFPHAVAWPKEAQPGTSLPGFSSGWLYALNPSSLLPILALLTDLDSSSSPSILDASAAPGGKSLAILNFLHPHLPTLITNDVSLPRFKRLRTVLKLYGYPDIPALHYSIQALPHHLTGNFDRILLDAPCSSEKHVFNSKKHLRIWSPNRSLNLNHLQSLLLESLFPLLKPGGRLVYSTCSISPQENQQVISEFLKRHPESSSIPFSPRNIPDFNPATWDPMFVATIQNQPS